MNQLIANTALWNLIKINAIYNLENQIGFYPFMLNAPLAPYKIFQINHSIEVIRQNNNISFLTYENLIEATEIINLNVGLPNNNNATHPITHECYVVLNQIIQTSELAALVHLHPRLSWGVNPRQILINP
jgi:hypothetical protein